MHRGIVVASRECDEKWHERSLKLHQQKLKRVKPSIDNRPPPMYPHLYQKLKKAQMEEERCSEIERDNRTLVRRMTEIMQRSAIDTHNANAKYHSLNRSNRRKELIRITQENQSLLRRIQRTQPTYNHLVWEQERDRNEVICGRLCRYPYRPLKPLGADMMMGGYGPDGVILPPINPNSPQPPQEAQSSNSPTSAETPAVAASSSNKNVAPAAAAASPTSPNAQSQSLAASTSSSGSSASGGAALNASSASTATTASVASKGKGKSEDREEPSESENETERPSSAGIPRKEPVVVASP